MSELAADIIQNTSGQTLLSNGYPYRPNRIIEYLASPCDGSQVAGASGIYTFPLVTAQQGGSTAYQLVTGSNIFYRPPEGTRFVKYQFTFSTYWVNIHSINHYKFYVDNIEIPAARFNKSSQYTEDKSQFSWVFQVGGTESPSTAKFTTWDTFKRLYLTFRQYGTANNGNHHGTVYWDGVTSNQFTMPLLSIMAMA